MIKRKKPSSASTPKKSDTSATKRRTPNSIDSQVGKSIRAHRLIARMSQSELGEKLGVSFQQVQKYEKGVNRVGAGRLPQIAEILNVPISALFNENTDASASKDMESAAPVELITDANVLRLLTSYADITDQPTRRCLVELVDQIATAARKSRRK